MQTWELWGDTSKRHPFFYRRTHFYSIQRQVTIFNQHKWRLLKTMQLLASPRNSTATERLFIKEKKHRRRNPNKVSKSEERNLLLRTWKQQEVTRHPNLKGLGTRSVSRTVRCSWGFVDHWEPQWLFRSLSSNDLSHLHLPAKQMVGATKWDLLATFLEALGLSVS